jgi:hypothetical protein
MDPDRGKRLEKLLYDYFATTGRMQLQPVKGDV